MKQIILTLEPCSFVGISALSAQTPLTTPAHSVQNSRSQNNGLSGAAGVVFGGLGSNLGIR